MAGQSSTLRHIVAMGGGGFSEEPDNPLLDDYVLHLTRKRRPRVCFVPTASGDAQGYIDKFYGAFPSTRARARHLTLFRYCGVDDLETFLLEQHVIYVGGGSSANMLAVWRVHGLDRILRMAWQSGVVLAGLSAGMICWFQEGLTDSLATGLSPLKDGLGLLRGSACPHYDSQEDRRPAYHRLIARGRLQPGIAADDGAAAHFVGRKLAAVVASRPDARAYRLRLTAKGVVEVPLDTRRLQTRTVRRSGAAKR